jgi:hypothetical protein
MAREFPEDYVSEFFKKPMYEATYRPNLGGKRKREGQVQVKVKMEVAKLLLLLAEIVL